MKKLRLLIILPLITMVLFGISYRAPLISAAQTLTTGWVDLGGEIDTGTQKFNKLHLWLEIDRNSGVDIRFRILDKYESGGTDEYVRGTITITANVGYIEPSYYEFNVDEDQKYHLVFLLDNVTPYVQIQVMAVTAGGAQIDSAYYSLGY